MSRPSGEGEDPAPSPDAEPPTVTHPAQAMAETPRRTEFETRFVARSYELDGFGHVNHSVFFRWFEHARFEAFFAAGLDLDAALGGGRAIVVVRADAEFRGEVELGDRVVVRTWAAPGRRSSLVFRQRAMREADDELAAEGSVVAVWLDSGGRPMRVPEAVRRGLGVNGEPPGSSGAP